MDLSPYARAVIQREILDLRAAMWRSDVPANTFFAISTLTTSLAAFGGFALEPAGPTYDLGTDVVLP